MALKIELLKKYHKKSGFDCGNAVLNNYLRRFASQDFKRNLSVCYVLTTENNEVIGYYTLSALSLPYESLPEKLRRKLPAGYRDFPVTLLGRLAVDKKYHGKGFGAMLLMDALKISYIQSQKIASLAVVVDPIDRQAVEFYGKYGFIQLDSGKMFIAMKTVARLIENSV